MFQFLTGNTGSARISADEAINGTKSGGVTVIDVREHGEVAATGKAAGALHIPLFMLPTKADPSHPECHPVLSTDRTIVLYCASGARSQSAVQMLMRFGYKDVRNLGGLNDWVRGGGEIERI